MGRISFSKIAVPGVGHQHHDEIGFGGGLGHGQDLQARPLRALPTDDEPLAQADPHIDA
ncbi:MAG: hypothetical protein R2749_30460 [Acidimicrobiales bacterium]